MQADMGNAMGNDLIAVIKAKQAEIAKLQAELDEARALLTGGERIVRPPARPSPAARPRPKARTKPLRKPSPPSRAAVVDVEGIMPTGSVAQAVEILREAQKPLYVMEIIKRIEERHGKKVKKDTLVGNLSRYVKAGKLFYRAGPNVYGLLELKPT